MKKLENGDLAPDPEGTKSIAVLAKLLGMSPWAVHLWINKKRIPGRKAEIVANLSEGRVPFEKFSPFIFDVMVVPTPISH